MSVHSGAYLVALVLACVLAGAFGFVLGGFTVALIY